MRLPHSLFPAFDQHFFTDIWKRRERIDNIVNGKSVRRTDTELDATNPSA